MFECLVDGCGRKFKGDYQRQMHLIDSHKFPKGLHHLFHPTVSSSRLTPHERI
jgi:hypothetical protein